jgi:hypothetical protein
VPCSASRVVPGAHRVVGPGTHRGSGPREVHTTEGTALAPEEPEEVSPPPPEEAPAPQPVEVVSAPTLTADEATWLVNLFYEAFNRRRQVAIHLGVIAPNDPL